VHNKYIRRLRGKNSAHFLCGWVVVPWPWCLGALLVIFAFPVFSSQPVTRIGRSLVLVSTSQATSSWRTGCQIYIDGQWTHLYSGLQLVLKPTGWLNGTARRAASRTQTQAAAKERLISTSSCTRVPRAACRDRAQHSAWNQPSHTPWDYNPTTPAYHKRPFAYILPASGQTAENCAKPSPPSHFPLDLSPDKTFLGLNGFSRRAPASAMGPCLETSEWHHAVRGQRDRGSGIGNDSS
jgi:hypothetical protein